MKTLKSKYFGAALCVGFAGFVTSSIVAQEQQNKEKQQVEKVVRQFWKSMGKSDFDGLKSTLAWPSIMQEVTPQSTSASFVYRNAADFEEERKHYQPSANNKAGQGDFATAAISNIKIDVLNQSVANVTYKYRLPQRQVANRKEVAQTLSMLTVLQKQPLQKTWKIAYTTIPQ